MEKKANDLYTKMTFEKRVFLSCYCHDTSRVDAIGLKNSSYTEKVTIVVNMWNFGHFFFFKENRYFGNNCLIKVQIWEFFCTHVTRIIVVIICTANFVSTKLMTDFLSEFCVFSAKSPSVTQISVSQENAFQKSKRPSPFLHKTIGSNNSFTFIENNF